MDVLAMKVAGTTTMVSEYLSIITNPFDNPSSEDLLKIDVIRGRPKSPAVRVVDETPTG